MNMNYVESYDILGINSKQIPCIIGKGAPTTTTEGAVGCFYMDTDDDGKLYKCKNVKDGVFTWDIFEGEKGEDGITPRIGDNGNWYIGDTDTGVRAEALAEGATVVQTTGESETSVMSQKAVTDEQNRLFNIFKSPNLYNPSTAHVRKALSNSVVTPGILIDNSAYWTSDFIKVQAGQILKFYNNAGGTYEVKPVRICGYTADSDDAGVASATQSSTTEYTVPDGILFIRFSSTIGNMDFGQNPNLNASFHVVEGDEIIPYYPFGYKEYKLKNECAPDNMAHNYWYGKNVLVIGDSITAAGIWQKQLSEILGMNVFTHAKGGQGMIAMVDGENGAGEFDNGTATSGILYALTSADVADKDLIVYFAGYNNRNTLCGNVGDCYDANDVQTHTIAGFLQYCINRIYEELENANNLTCRVIVVTPHCVGKYSYIDVDGYGEYPIGSGQTLQTIAETLEKVANYNNIPCYNAWENSGINKFTWGTYSASPTSDSGLTEQGSGGQYYWNADQLHLNYSVGYPHLGRCIAKFINTI